MYFATSHFFVNYIIYRPCLYPVYTLVLVIDFEVVDGADELNPHIYTVLFYKNCYHPFTFSAKILNSFSSVIQKSKLIFCIIPPKILF